MRIHSRRRSVADPRRLRARAGLTLVEMIIAIIVLAIGVMGLAGTASYVTMQMGGGKMQTVAAGVAQAVADSLSARRCADVVDGTATTRGVTVAWQVADSTRTRWVRQTVQYTRNRGEPKTHTYLVVIQCPEL